MVRRTVKDFGPDPIDQYVGGRIRARRVGLRMSQTSLGEAVDVTFQQIQKYENGTNRVGASNLYRIAQALGVSVGFFFEGMPEELIRPGNGGNGAPVSATSTQSDPMTSREAIELVHNFFMVENETARRRLFQFIKALAVTDRT